MTAPALVKQADLKRAAEVANGSGCKIEIKIGEAVITVIPRSEIDFEKSKGIDYSRPVL